MSNELVHLRIKRQDKPDSNPYWEEFKIPRIHGMNVISALQEIQRNPVNIKGQRVNPVVWESVCLEEVCGACSMVINGKARQACAALISTLKDPITIEPMSKFPTIRDLKVNRTVMFERLKKIKGWVPINGTFNLGPGPQVDQSTQERSYAFSRCMTCGVCLEVCPQVEKGGKGFMGANVMGQVAYFNLHPNGRVFKKERLDAVSGEGGITDCGNAQNCVKACPKEVPLLDGIAQVSRDTTLQAFVKIFDKD